MGITRQSWGTTPDGAEVELFTLVNSQGHRAVIATYGATLVELHMPDRTGSLSDVVLGYDSLNGYLNDCCFFGCMVGRVANRISGASFVLDGTTYDLDKNHGDHQLHGGSKGFNTHVWTANPMETRDGPAVALNLVSRDGDQGYPGTVETTVVYTLTETALRLECHVVTDRTTVVNLTNHTCFNLSGDLTTDILDHVVTINASHYLATDDEQIPTGEVADLAGTPLDFLQPAAIGLRIEEPFDALVISQGYDHFYVIEGSPDSMKLAAQIFHGATGRGLEVRTTQPGVQFYSGNHMPEQVHGKLGVDYGRRSGLCMETQGYTDAPNQPGFPSVVLQPGEVYKQTTEYCFSVK